MMRSTNPGNCVTNAPPSSSHTSVPFTSLLTVALLLGVVTVSSWANDLTVRVSKRGTSQLLGAAVVCLGTPADYAQFGTVVTGSNGDVQFSQVPTSTTLVLTVSKRGFQGRQIVIDPFRSDQTVLLTLSAGGGGPACGQPAPAAEPVASNLLGIEDFRINGGADETGERVVTLSYAVTGAPSHYRVSEDPDFGSAVWMPFRSGAKYRLSQGAGTKTVYFQLRRMYAQSGASIQGESDVASSRIRLGKL